MKQRRINFCRIFKGVWFLAEKKLLLNFCGDVRSCAWDISEILQNPFFFACPLFREPGKFVKITGHENLNTVAFQCNRKQKRQNYGVQNNYIDSNAKIKGSQSQGFYSSQNQPSEC